MNLSRVYAGAAACTGEGSAAAAASPEEAFTALLSLLVPQARPPDGAAAGGEGPAAPPDRAEAAVHATEEWAPVLQADGAPDKPRSGNPDHVVRSDGSEVQTRSAALWVVLEAAHTVATDGAPPDGRVGDGTAEGGWVEGLARPDEVTSPEEGQSLPPAHAQSRPVGPAVQAAAWLLPVLTGGADQLDPAPRQRATEQGGPAVHAVERPTEGVGTPSPVPALGPEEPDRPKLSGVLVGHQAGSSEPKSQPAPQGSSQPAVPPHGLPEGPRPQEAGRAAVGVAVDGPRLDGAVAEPASLPTPSRVGKAQIGTAESAPVAGQGGAEHVTARAQEAARVQVTIHPTPHADGGPGRSPGVAADGATRGAVQDGQRLADDAVPAAEGRDGRRRAASEARPQVGQVGRASESGPSEAGPAGEPAPAPQLPRERTEAPRASYRLQVELQDARGEPVRVEVRARSDTVWARVEGSPQVAQAVRGEAQALYQALQGQGLSLVGLEVDTLPRGRTGAFDEPRAYAPSGRAKAHRHVEEIRAAPGSVDYVV